MTVVGVMPASFDNVASPGAQIWRALGYANQPWTCRTCHHLRMLARIRPDVSMDAAVTELDQIHKRMEKAYPDQYGSVGALVVTMQDEATREFRPALLALRRLVLLIAVANAVSRNWRAVRARKVRDPRAALGAKRSGSSDAADRGFAARAPMQRPLRYARLPLPFS
jgi:hypothetical protein